MIIVLMQNQCGIVKLLKWGALIGNSPVYCIVSKTAERRTSRLL